MAKKQSLAPGDLVFININGEEASPGWYKVLRFDHQQTREFGPGWWWQCSRLCDGLLQTICETSKYLVTDCEGKPHQWAGDK